MKELKLILIVSIIIILAIIIFTPIYLLYSTFNFHKSEIIIDGNKIYEKLYYKPDKDFHTLYRNFVSQVYLSNYYIKNSIVISNVSCSNGMPYVRTYIGECLNFKDNSSNCLDYTENNEYGCSFGNIYGFKEGNEYIIEAQYLIIPENLFLINGNKYIKFVAYSPDNHKLLIKGNNLIISGNHITNKIFFPKDYVIIYIPYESNEYELNIIEKENFEYDSILTKIILIIILLIPLFSFIIIWIFFGREKTYLDIPNELSTYPIERKAWEVNTFFNPPFLKPDKNFFSLILTDFYHRKIIDMKIIDKDVFVKILNENHKSLDKVEKMFLDLLKFIHQIAIDNKNSKSFFIFNKEEYIDGNYFNLTKTISYSTKITQLRKKFKEIEKEIKTHGKKYLDNKGVIIYSIFQAIMIFLLFIFMQFSIISYNFIPHLIFAFIEIIILSTIAAKSSLLIKFKEDYYIEYLKWQAYKNHINHTPSLKLHGYKGTIIWEKYLIYATAFGISAKILNELKDAKIITEREYNLYSGVHMTSNSFSSSAGASGSSGGFGGAGGGGSGGGGGGGR